MILGLLAAPGLALSRGFRAALRAENVLAFAPVFWIMLDTVPGAYEMEGLRRQDVRGVFRVTGVFVIAIWLAALQRPWRIPSSIRRVAASEWSGSSYFFMALLAFALGFLRFAVPVNFDLAEMLHYMGEMRWNAPWARGQLGGWDSFLDHMKYFGYVLPMLTVLTAWRLGWVSWRVILLIFLNVVMIVLLAQGGGRRIVGVLCGSGLVCWMLCGASTNFGRAAVGTALAFALLAFLQVMLNYRNVGLSALFDAARREEVRKFEEFRVDDNFLRIGQMIQFIPEHHPYVYHRYFIWVLVRPVPRVFWPGKPTDPGFDLAQYLGREHVAYSSSIIGELWMAGGFWAVFLGGWVFGRLARTASTLLSTKMAGGGLVLYCAFLLALFAGVRSGLELILMSYMVLVWFALVATGGALGLKPKSNLPRPTAGAAAQRLTGEGL